MRLNFPGDDTGRRVRGIGHARPSSLPHGRGGRG
jgi:hypothetical protein